MEDVAIDIFYQCRQKAAAATQTKPRVGKPPTRLQKHAPSSLMVVQRTGNDFSNSTSPIPLLTPVAASPPPLPQQETEEFRFPILFDNTNLTPDGGRTHPGANGGRTHPGATGGYIEPSSLINFFQSKCVLVDHSQY